MQLLELLVSERSLLKDANSFLNILGFLEHWLRILCPRMETKLNHFRLLFLEPQKDSSSAIDKVEPITALNQVYGNLSDCIRYLQISQFI